MTNTIEQNVERICNVLYNKKAVDIVAINIADKSVIADYFVICSGKSSIAVKALCDELEKELGGDLDLRRREGYNEGRWIVLDFADILVHIFHPEEREYYNIERLWEDGTNYRDYSAEMAAKEPQQ